MNMIIPFNGRVVSVEEVFRSVGPREGFLLRLFVDPIAAAPNLAADDYGYASFVGGGPIQIARNTFQPAVLFGGLAQLVRLPAPSWTMTGGVGETVYGWVLIGDTTDTVYAAQTFDEPHTFTLGATLTLDPFKIDCTQI